MFYSWTDTDTDGAVDRESCDLFPGSDILEEALEPVKLDQESDVLLAAEKKMKQIKGLSGFENVFTDMQSKNGGKIDSHQFFQLIKVYQGIQGQTESKNEEETNEIFERFMVFLNSREEKRQMGTTQPNVQLVECDNKILIPQTGTVQNTEVNALELDDRKMPAKTTMMKVPAVRQSPSNTNIGILDRVDETKNLSGSREEKKILSLEDSEDSDDSNEDEVIVLETRKSVISATQEPDVGSLKFSAPRGRKSTQSVARMPDPEDVDDRSRQSDVARRPLPEDVDDTSLASEPSSGLGKTLSSESDYLPGEDEVFSKEKEGRMEVDSLGGSDLAAEEWEEEKDEKQAFVQNRPDCKESDDSIEFDDKSVMEKRNRKGIKRVRQHSY